MVLEQVHAAQVHGAEIVWCAELHSKHSDDMFLVVLGNVFLIFYFILKISPVSHLLKVFTCITRTTSSESYVQFSSACSNVQ